MLYCILKYSRFSHKMIAVLAGDTQKKKKKKSTGWNAQPALHRRTAARAAQCATVQCSPYKTTGFSLFYFFNLSEQDFSLYLLL